MDAHERDLLSFFSSCLLDYCYCCFLLMAGNWKSAVRRNPPIGFRVGQKFQRARGTMADRLAPKDSILSLFRARTAPPLIKRASPKGGRGARNGSSNRSYFWKRSCQRHLFLHCTSGRRRNDMLCPRRQRSQRMRRRPPPARERRWTPTRETYGLVFSFCVLFFCLLIPEMKISRGQEPSH